MCIRDSDDVDDDEDNEDDDEMLGDNEHVRNLVFGTKRLCSYSRYLQWSVDTKRPYDPFFSICARTIYFFQNNRSSYRIDALLDFGINGSFDLL